MKTAPAILSKNLKILKEIGEHTQLARLRRKLSTEQIAERTGQVGKPFIIYNKLDLLVLLETICKSFLYWV